MAADTNYWKLGLFLTTSVAVGLVVLAYFATPQRETHEVNFFFDEAVDGVTEGSDVRYRGIKIGAVKVLRAAPDRRMVRVIAELDVKKIEDIGFRDRTHGPDDIEGLAIRGYIDRNPLTGQAVIQMERYEPGKLPPPPDYSFELPPATIHTVRSVVKGLIADLTATLSTIPGAVRDTRNLVQTLDQSIRDAKVGTTIEELRRFVELSRDRLASLDVNAIVDAATGIATDGRKTLGKLDEAITEVRKLAAALHQDDSPLQRLLIEYRELGETLDREITAARFPDTSAALRTALGSATELSAEARDALATLRRDVTVIARAADAIRRLAIVLERDPASLLRGRTKPERPTKGR